MLRTRRVPSPPRSKSVVEKSSENRPRAKRCCDGRGAVLLDGDEPWRRKCRSHRPGYDGRVLLRQHRGEAAGDVADRALALDAAFDLLARGCAVEVPAGRRARSTWRRTPQRPGVRDPGRGRTRATSCAGTPRRGRPARRRDGSSGRARTTSRPRRRRASGSRRARRRARRARPRRRSPTTEPRRRAACLQARARSKRRRPPRSAPGPPPATCTRARPAPTRRAPPW